MGDLEADRLRAAMPGRPIRTYPALLSTQADALAWARAGAPEGAVVVADYQASPRGRAGLEWKVKPGSSLSFSMVLRPDLPPEREGWLYTLGISGMADVFGMRGRIEWPDQVVDGSGERLGALGVHSELGPHRVDWAVLSVLVPEGSPPRGQQLAMLVDAIERRARDEPEAVLAEYGPRCRTLGRRVRARMIPMGPGGLVIEGRAASTKQDGAMVIQTTLGSRVAVRPQNLGLLEEGAEVQGEETSTD